MKFKNTIVFAAVLAMGVSSFAADEISENKSSDKDMGIRISLGVSPGINEGEIFGGSFDLEDDTGGQFEILYQRRHWGKSNPDIAGIWGAGVFFSGASGTDGPSGDEFDLNTFGVMGQGGIAIKAGNVIVLEAQPYIGFGVSSVEITDFTDGSAPYFMMGIKAGAFFKLSEKVELGFEAGYQGFSSEVEIEFIGGPTEDLTLSGGGLHASAVLAIKF